MNYTTLVGTIQAYTENDFPNSSGTGGLTSTQQINTFIQEAEQRIYNTVQLLDLRKNVTGNATASNMYLTVPTDWLANYSLAVIDPVTGGYDYLLNKDVNFIREAFPYPSVSGFPTHYAIFGPQSAAPNELSFMVGPTPDQNYGVELHYFFYPPSIIPGIIISLNSSFTAGSGYTNGTYYNQALTGGTGSGATANIVVSGGAVTSVSLETGGSGYAVGDSLSISLGSGGGFAITVPNASSLNQTTGQTWLGDNYDAALLYGTLVEAITFMKGEQDLVGLYNGKYTEALAQAKRLGDGLERQDSFRNGQYRQKVT